MENLIVYLCNDKPVKPRKSRKSTKKKPKLSDPSVLNEDLKNDLKSLRKNLEIMKQDKNEKEQSEIILTPRSKEKSERLKKKMHFLKKAQSSYEFKRR